MNSIKEMALEIGQKSCGEEHVEWLQRIAKQVPDEGVIIECGVGRGCTAAILVDAANKLSPQRKVYLCDTFNGFPAPEPIDLNSDFLKDIVEGTGRGFLTEDFARENIKKCGLSLKNVIFIKGLFKDTLPVLAKTHGKISLIHFDGDFYQSAKDVLDNLWPLVVPGGFIVFHDYPVCDGVKKAVEERFSMDEIIPITIGSCYVQKK